MVYEHKHIERTYTAAIASLVNTTTQYWKSNSERYMYEGLNRAISTSCGMHNSQFVSGSGAIAK
jgi:hypothetical protein